MKKIDRRFLCGEYTRKIKENNQKEYGRSIEHVRKSNVNDNLKLSNIQKQKGEYNVVTIDKNCLSCTNSNPAVISAFKMACLAYYPSNIVFEGKSMPRALLHMKKIKIIQNLYSNYQNLQPWRSGKCNFDKYLDIDTVSILNSRQSAKSKFNIMSVTSKIVNPLTKVHRNSHTPNECSNRKTNRISLLPNDQITISPFRQEVQKNKTIQITQMELENYRNSNNYSFNNTISLEPRNQDHEYIEKIVNDNMTQLDVDMISTRNEQSIQILGKNIERPLKHSFSKTRKTLGHLKKSKVIHIG